jgi:hypothetical protein
MTRSIILILTILTFFLIPCWSVAQEKRNGLSLAAIAGYNSFILSEEVNGIKTILRGDHTFPDQYHPGYQIGFIKEKSSWNQSRMNFTYFPSYTREYTEYEISGVTQPLPVNRQIEMDIYMLELAKSFRINLFAGMLHLNLGFGANGGAIQWIPDQLPEDPMLSLSGSVYPSGGLEFLLFNQIGIIAEFRYHYGLSETVSKSFAGTSYKWKYNLEGREIKAGINIYF